MDEAQNTTTEQMKMFLTRLGNNSKAVITGDITQIDLPNPKKSGLVEAINLLEGVEGISSATLRMSMWCGTLWSSGLSGLTRVRAQQRELPLGIVDGPEDQAGQRPGLAVKPGSKPQ